MWFATFPVPLLDQEVFPFPLRGDMHSITITQLESWHELQQMRQLDTGQRCYAIREFRRKR